MDEQALLDTPKRATLTSRSTTLRADLKKWEKTFAEDNGGRRAGKTDIKQHPNIAAKYKEYNRLRDLLTGGAPAPSLKSSSPRVHESRSLNTTQSFGVNEQYATPRKQDGRSSLCGLQPYNLDPYDAPSHASPLPQMSFARPMISPTPHRDGRAIGLFDLLVRSGSSQETPSSRKRKAHALQEVNVNIARTPSRRSGEANLSHDALEGSDNEYHAAGKLSRERLSRTPASEGRQYLLRHFFTTPSTNRYQVVLDEASPGGLSPKLPSLETTPEIPGRQVTTTPRRDMEECQPAATPPFLKRPSFNQRLLSVFNKQTSPPMMSQSSLFLSPEAVTIGPQILGSKYSRGLSDIVKNLQKLDDERHDDDLDALRDIENDGPVPQILIGDSQVGRVDGRDRDPTDQREPEQYSTEPNLPPAQTWKKKGQKRTTRRVNMKPSSAKPIDAPKWIEEGSEDELAVVQESQIPGPLPLPEDGEMSSCEVGDMNHLESDSEASRSSKKRKKTSKKKGPGLATKMQRNLSNSKQEKQSDHQGNSKKRTYNPNAPSHLNFRSLKIKNRHSKAKGRGFGRGFGRRR